jgi:hypothetical protein
VYIYIRTHVYIHTHTSLSSSAARAFTCSLIFDPFSFSWSIPQQNMGRRHPYGSHGRGGVGRGGGGGGGGVWGGLGGGFGVFIAAWTLALPVSYPAMRSICVVIRFLFFLISFDGVDVSTACQLPSNALYLCVYLVSSLGVFCVCLLGVFFV